MQQWLIGAPTGRGCCSVDCDYDSHHDDFNQATWTLQNPADGGDPLYFCNECKEREEAAQHGFGGAIKIDGKWIIPNV